MASTIYSHRPPLIAIPGWNHTTDPLLELTATDGDHLVDH